MRSRRLTLSAAISPNADAGVSEEQDDEPAGLVLAFIETAMLAHVTWAGARLSESLDLGVGQEALLLLGRAREINAGRDVAGASVRPLTAMLRISESTRWTLRTVAGERVFDSAVTHFCTSAWETLASFTRSHLGRMCSRMIPAYRCVGGRLEVGLVVEPVCGPVPHRDPREHRVDEGPGVLG